MTAFEGQIEAWFACLSTGTPDLIVTYRSLEEDVSRVVQAETLIVVDPYNAAAFTDRYPFVTVADDSDAATVKTISERFSPRSIVAIGGCTALDVGRAVANGMPVTCIPTILSSSCISSGTSVIKGPQGYASQQTTRPTQTILNMPTLITNHRDQRKNWSASGIGDLLSTLGAVAERNLDGEANLAVFERAAPLCMAALDWIDQVEYPLNEANLVMLGKLLHIFSISGHATAPVGSEHLLYYTTRERHNLPRMLATHGRIVAGASLWPVRAWCWNARTDEFLTQIERVFEKVGLPVRQSDFTKIGVSISVLRDAVKYCESAFYERQSTFNGPDWFVKAREDGWGNV